MSDQSLGELRREWRRLSDRYGRVDPPPELDRLQTATNKKQVKLRHLESQLAELHAQVTVLYAEISGLDKTIGLVLAEAIRDLRDVREETWSPVPVLGFRLWDVRVGGFYGFREQWKHPTLTAYCPTTRTCDEVPHTDGRCGVPACGIYAAKDITRLIKTHADDFLRMAVGLVAMTGKVVEHEHGYRSAEAEVLAIAFVLDRTVFTSNDPDELSILFQGVGLSSSPSSEVELQPANDQPDPVQVRSLIVKYLKKEKERRSHWTSGSPNES